MKTTQQSPEASNTILIVDDSPDNLIVMKKVLEKALPGVTILTCQYPEKAQAVLQETEVALTVLDVQMPKINGLELCKRIKNDAATSFVSVMLITSHDSDPKMKATGMALGADDFITRPMDNAELCARVKVVLRVHYTESILRDTAGQAEAEAAKFSHVLEDSLNEIYIFDAETFHFLNVNRGARENIGYSIEELREMTPLDITPKINPEAFKALIKPLRDGSEKKIQIEAIHRRKNGTDYPVEIHLQLMANESSVFVAISNDITERKHTERALSESEVRYDQLARQSRIVVWEVDTNGLYTYCSHVVENVLGYRPDELVGLKYFYDLHPEEERDAFKKEASEVFSRKEVFQNLENRIETKEGHIVWALTTGIPLRDEQGELLGYRGSDTDITDRKQAEEALRKSEAWVQSVIRAAPTGIGVVVDRALKEVNERLCVMAGYSKEELIGQSSRMLYSTDEDYEQVGREKYEQIRDHGTGTVETCWMCKDGHHIDVLLSSTPIDLDDLSKGVTFTALDITARKQAEQSLKERNRELERFNRASVGRELKMIELKKEINALCKETGKPEPYPLNLTSGNLEGAS